MITILKSEYLKIIYNKWLLLTFISTVIAVPLFILFLNGETDNSNAYIAKQILESYYLGQAGGLVFTVLFIGQEFVKSSLRSSLLAVPKRRQFILGKLLALLSVMILMWLLITLLSTVIIYLYYGKGLEGHYLYLVEEFLLLFVFESTSLLLICYSLVLMSQSIVLSLALSLSFLLGLGQVLLQFNSHFLFLPVLATMNLFLLESSSSYLPVLTGLLVQSGWALLLAIISTEWFTRRSIR